MKFCSHTTILSVNSSGHGGLDMKIDDDTFVITLFEYCRLCGAYRTERDEDWVAPAIQKPVELMQEQYESAKAGLEVIKKVCEGILG
jgi:hypothetical protein